jgi:hypothetical protein
MRQSTRRSRLSGTMLSIAETYAQVNSFPAPPQPNSRRACSIPSSIPNQDLDPLKIFANGQKCSWLIGYAINRDCPLDFLKG